MNSLGNETCELKEPPMNAYKRDPITETLPELRNNAFAGSFQLAKSTWFIYIDLGKILLAEQHDVPPVITPFDEKKSQISNKERNIKISIGSLSTSSVWKTAIIRQLGRLTKAESARKTTTIRLVTAEFSRTEGQINLNNTHKT